MVDVVDRLSQKVRHRKLDDLRVVRAVGAQRDRVQDNNLFTSAQRIKGLGERDGF